MHACLQLWKQESFLHNPNRNSIKKLPEMLSVKVLTQLHIDTYHNMQHQRSDGKHISHTSKSESLWDTLIMIIWVRLCVTEVSWWAGVLWMWPALWNADLQGLHHPNSDRWSPGACLQVWYPCAPLWTYLSSSYPTPSRTILVSVKGSNRNKMRSIKTVMATIKLAVFLSPVIHRIGVTNINFQLWVWHNCHDVTI